MERYLNLEKRRKEVSKQQSDEDSLNGEIFDGLTWK